MRASALRALLGAVSILLLAVPTVSAEVGPDYVSSDNVTLTARIKTVGDGVGGRVVGNYLYVTSTKSLSIFDISKNPANPPQVGLMTLDVEWENEEVPTNGKILGISASAGCKDPLGVLEGSPRNPAGSTNCLNLYDVRDPANVKFIKSVPGSGEHVSACVLDCTWFYGDNGSITDARDPKQAKLVEGQNFITNSGIKTGCHAVREIADGIIFGSCQPLVLWSVRPEHGGSITKPAVLAVAKNSDNRFIHSNRWPRLGTDRFALVGGEQNAQPQCDDQVSAFMVWDATPALDPAGGFKRGDGTFTLVDEVRPRSGTYADGNSPYNVLGCSVHWFQEQPAFRNGGLVALAEYEQGTRFLQVTPAGKIIEQGYFLPMGGSTSSPLWHPNGKHVYNIDYTRGIDVLEWKGATYRGGPDPFSPGTAEVEPGSSPGTNGARDEAAIAALKAREAQNENCTPTARTASARGSGRTLKLSVPAASRFDAEIFQVSKGRTVLRSKRVKRFRNKTGEVTWKAGRKLRSGYYVIRFTTPDGRREIAVRLAGKRFRSAPPFSETGCGIIRSYSLDGPVFGGRTKRALGVNFQLTQNADQVVVEVLRRGKLTRRVTRKSVNAGQAVRLKLRGKGITRGDLQVRLTALRGGTRIVSATLAARGI